MRINSSVRVSCIALAAGMGALPTAGHAQGTAATAPVGATATAAETDSTVGEGGLQDIIVTAQRRPEKVQSIPVAVSAFTEQTIRALNLNDAISVSKYVPSMISQHNAGLATANSYFLRGLGNTQSAATFDPPVGTYVDDIYVARQNANNYAYFDTERVEVLRGPQGTLFGRNTTGGAVNLIMRKPSEDFGGRFEVTGGSYRRFTVKGSVDAPISEKILTKLSAFYVTDRGFLKNITTGEHLNGDKSYGVRGDVRLKPTDALTIDLSGEYTNNQGTYFGVRVLPIADPKFRTATTPVFYEAAMNMRQVSCKGDPVTILMRTQDGLLPQHRQLRHVRPRQLGHRCRHAGGDRRLSQAEPRLHQQLQLGHGQQICRLHPCRQDPQQPAFGRAEMVEQRPRWQAEVCRRHLLPEGE